MHLPTSFRASSDVLISAPSILPHHIATQGKRQSGGDITVTIVAMRITSGPPECGPGLLRIVGGISPSFAPRQIYETQLAALRQRSEWSADRRVSVWGIAGGVARGGLTDHNLWWGTVLAQGRFRRSPDDNL